MGMICPTCGVQASIKRNITADGKTPKKQTDIVAYDLSCGHTIGGEEYAAYSKKVAELKATYREQIVKLQKEANGKIAALASMLNKKEDK